MIKSRILNACVLSMMLSLSFPALTYADGANSSDSTETETPGNGNSEGSDQTGGSGDDDSGGSGNTSDPDNPGGENNGDSSGNLVTIPVVILAEAGALVVAQTSLATVVAIMMASQGTKAILVAPIIPVIPQRLVAIAALSRPLIIVHQIQDSHLMDPTLQVQLPMKTNLTQGLTKTQTQNTLRKTPKPTRPATTKARLRPLPIMVILMTARLSLPLLSIALVV